jgi:protein-L-isoaspartate O-methyltransferase
VRPGSGRPGPPSRQPAAAERGRLTAHGVRPKRRLGQNFLLDPRVVHETVRRAVWPSGSPVIEIGPGGGALTAELLAAGLRVTAVEIDASLVVLLHERFAAEIEAGLLRVVGGDILEVDLERMRFLDITFDHSAHTLYSNEQNLIERLAMVDLLIGAVLVPGAAARCSVAWSRYAPAVGPNASASRSLTRIPARYG